MNARLIWTCLTVWLVLSLCSSVHAGPYASRLIEYTPGLGISGMYTDPNTALGAPEQFTGEGVYPGIVTMFNAPFGADEIVSIGPGGSLVVAFEHQVRNDSRNPFGIDFLVFGNASFTDQEWPNGIAGGVFSEPARIRVSQDNITWYDIAGVTADNLFPTQGFTDTSGPYSYSADFTKPVNPSLADHYVGMSYGELLVAYAGSGGGAGVDLTWAVDAAENPVGLDWIQYVEIWQPETDTWSAEIDALADVAAVPLPGALWLLGSGLIVIFGIQRGRRE